MADLEGGQLELWGWSQRAQMLSKIFNSFPLLYLPDAAWKLRHSVQLTMCQIWFWLGFCSGLN